jgi:hypothetical protein
MRRDSEYSVLIKEAGWHGISWSGPAYVARALPFRHRLKFPSTESPGMSDMPSSSSPLPSPRVPTAQLVEIKTEHGRGVERE